MAGDAVQQRRKCLQRRLRQFGVPDHEARKWVVTCVAPKRYRYVHPTLGAFDSLTAAREASQRAVCNDRRRPWAAPHGAVDLPAGSPRAAEVLSRSRWRGAGDGVQLADDIARRVWVRIMPSRRRDGWRAAEMTVDWLTTTGRMAFVGDDCACVVKSGSEYEFLAVYIRDHRVVRAAVQQVRPLCDALTECMGDCYANRGIHMFGPRKMSRRNCYQSEQDEEDAVGYFRVRRGVHLSAIPERVIEDAARTMVDLERRVSPAAAVWRVRRAGRHPGVIAGSDVKVTIGVSRGLHNRPHSEVGAGGEPYPPEAIVFDGRGVLPRYGFMCAEAFAVFDVRPGAFVMVPGDVVHGTPAAGDGSEEHGGMGAVLVNKLGPDDCEFLCKRVEQNGAHMNPYRKGFDFTNEARDALPCVKCGGGDGDALLCSNCNGAIHMRCAGLSRVPAGRFWCPACTTP